MSTWSTDDRCYSYTDHSFTKRTLRPNERAKDLYGQIINRPWTKERLRNEYLALKLISERTTIPVPKVLEFEDSGDLVSLTIELIHGYNLESSAIGDRDRAVSHVREYILKSVLPQLRSLTQSQIGSLTGDIIPSPRLDIQGSHLKLSKRGDYIFCHGDLAQHNIIINKESYDVMAILDWEYSGYYPPEFELPLWQRSSKEDGYDEIGSEQIPHLIGKLKGSYSAI